MKILVVGAGGFVGRNVTEYMCSKGHEVVALGHKELDSTDSDAVRKCLEEGKFDLVLHYAVDGRRVEEAVDINMKMYQNFANNSNLFGRMIYAGSGAEYGKQFDIKSVHEEEIGNVYPADWYGVGKYKINELIRHSENIYSLRIFGLFGPGEGYATKYISGLCAKAIKDKPLSYQTDCYFDYLWIEDYCKMLDAFIQLENPKYHDYNIVSGKRIALSELAEIVREISGKDLEIIHYAEGLKNEYTASNDRLLAEIGEIEFTDIREAIEKLYHWYETQEIDESLFLYQ